VIRNVKYTIYLVFLAAGFFTVGLSATADFSTVSFFSTTFLVAGDFLTTGASISFSPFGVAFLGDSTFSTGLTIFLTALVSLENFAVDVFSDIVLIFNFPALDLGSLIILTGTFLETECFTQGFSILVFAPTENASISLKVRCLA